MQTACEDYLFNSFGCEERESRRDKVRVRGRETDFRQDGKHGMFLCRKEWTESEKHQRNRSLKGNGQH